MMNAMSVSPVKPPLNAGNVTVSPTATDLTKAAPALTNNSYSPLNLVPESKPVSTVILASPVTEKSIDLCLKPTPLTATSNGTVSPLLEATQVAAAASTTQNCVETSETAENLTKNNSVVVPKIEIANKEPSRTRNDIEEKKEVVQKPVIEIIQKPSGEVVQKPSEAVLQKQSVVVKEKSVEVKGTIDTEKIVSAENENLAQTTAASETPVVVESVPKKEEKKTEPAAANIAEEAPKSNTTSSLIKTKQTPPTEEVSKLLLTAVTPKIEVKGDVKEKPKTPVKPESVSSAKIDVQPPLEEATSKVAPKATKRKVKVPIDVGAEEESVDGRKSKRTRLPTQPYQSPIPELQLIAKLNTPVKSIPKPSAEKIITFYKNEFLAVRNPEGSFYICQAFQNIHRSSSKIKIRWFTNLPQNIYTPDFYDVTEFDCILTNVKMTRVEKDRWKLPDHEHTRIENILKRALDVEKGVVTIPYVTEEHPDGLDLSLFKDETQLQKRKRKLASPKKAKTLKEKEVKTPRKTKKVNKPAVTPSTGIKKSARVSSYLSRDSSKTKPEEIEKPVKKEKKKKNNKVVKKQSASAGTSKPNEKVSSKTWEPSVKASNSSRVVLSLKKDDTLVKAVSTPESKTTKRMSSVSQKASAAAAAAVATTIKSRPVKRKKEEPNLTSSNQPAATERLGKVRNAGSAVAAKINSAAMRTIKGKECETAPSNQGKK